MAQPPAGRPGPWRRPGFQSGFGFLVYVWQRFNRDHCKERAASLTFTSLLALVPLLAISFAIFAAFPAFQNMRGDLQSFIFQNFVPEIGSIVYEHIEGFIGKTGQMTAVGVAFLAVTSILLLSSINGTFNAIWHVRESRGLVSRLLVYWAVLTLSPVLFGASLSLSSYLFAAAQATGVESYTGPLSELAEFVPLLLQIVGFSILYLVMPYFPVRRLDAFFGGLSAGLLFELLKKAFGFYIANFPAYETLYGALAVFPFLLLWMYFAWIVVLFGAEMTAAMPEWRAGVRRVRRTAVPAARLLAAALAILHALYMSSLRGRGLSSRRMARAAPAAPEAVTAAREMLQAANYIARGDRGEWLLSRDLDSVTLHDLKRHFQLDLDITDLRHIPKRGWGKRYGDLIARLNEADEAITAVPLKTLLGSDADAEIIDFPDPADDDPDDRITDRKTKLLALFGLTTIGGS